MPQGQLNRRTCQLSDLFPISNSLSVLAPFSSFIYKLCTQGTWSQAVSTFTFIQCSNLRRKRPLPDSYSQKITWLSAVTDCFDEETICRETSIARGKVYWSRVFISTFQGVKNIKELFKIQKHISERAKN